MPPRLRMDCPLPGGEDVGLGRVHQPEHDGWGVATQVRLRVRMTYCHIRYSDSSCKQIGPVASSPELRSGEGPFPQPGPQPCYAVRSAAGMPIATSLHDNATRRERLCHPPATSWKRLTTEVTETTEPFSVNSVCSVVSLFLACCSGAFLFWPVSAWPVAAEEGEAVPQRSQLRPSCAFHVFPLSPLIERWLLDMIDDEDLDLVLGWFQLQAKLLLDGREKAWWWIIDRRRIVTLRLLGRVATEL